MVNSKSALLVAVLAAGVAYHPASNVAPPSSTRTTQTLPAGARTVTYDKDLPIRDWPLEAIHDSLPDKSKVPDSSKLKFAVATVPDPQNSQYPFIFDAFMQSIQRAFGSAGYNLDRFWLPWDADPAPVDSDFILHEQHRDWLAKLQSNPGVLVFRKDDARICLFLVGESAITGIRKSQFFKAAAIMRDFPGQAHAGVVQKTPITVLGPSFTGSAASLREAFQALPSDAGHTYTFDYVTGSATGAEALDQLNKIVAKHGMSSHNTIGSIDIALNKFLQYASGKTSKHQIAMLREAGTTFSQIAKQSTDKWNTGDKSGAKIKVFEYPIQISRLRNAYGNDPDLAGLSQTPTASAPPKLGLEIPLKDEHESQDHVPSFSAQITPVSQEAAVLNTLATIDRQHIEYVVIVASDIMDSVFLGRLLKQHCPNARPFILDADLIYGHISENNAFDGMLMATNYPLFYLPGRDKPEDKSQMDQQQFSSAAEEGEYWATLQLISHLNSTRFQSFVDSPWLAVVGRDGIWPIQEPAVYSASSNLAPITASLGWKLGFYFVALFCIAFSGVGVYLNWNSTSHHLPLGWLSALLTNQGASRIFLAMTSFLLLAFFILLAWFQLSIANLVSVEAAVSILTITFLLAGALCGGLPKLKPDPNSKISAQDLESQNRLRLTLQVLGSITAAMVIVALLPRDTPGQNALIFRTVHVGNGVSPIVPIAFLTAALVWFLLSHLNRLRLLHLFPVPSEEFSHDPFLCKAEALQSELHQILGNWATGGPEWVLVIAFALLVSTVLMNPLRISSVESFPFERVYALGLYILYFGLLLEFVRFLRSWTTLQRLLHMLERHMLSQAFRRVGKKTSGPSLWHWSGSGHPYRVLAQFLNRLKSLSDQQLIYSDTYYENCLADLRGNAKSLLSDSSGLHVIDATTLHHIKLDTHAVFSSLVKAMLNEWRTPTAPPAAMAATATGTSHPSRLPAPKTLPAHAHPLAEEMIALRFVEVIAQVNLQLKNNLEFIAAALILAVISLNSYPFEPRHSMTSMITIYFFAMSAVFLIVFMQMSRNTIISYLSNTTPGKLDGNLFHVLSFGGLPLLAVISSQFPSIGGFLFAWVKPALETLR